MSYNVYKQSSDKTALYISVAFVIYGIAPLFLIAQYNVAGFTMIEAMTSVLIARIVAIIIMLYAFVAATK